MGIAFFRAASRQLDMLGLNTSIHKQIREDVCQYMSNLDEDKKSWRRVFLGEIWKIIYKKLS